MKTITKNGLLVLLASTMAGCSWIPGFGDDEMFRDRGDDYRRANIEKPLTIPEHLNASQIEDTYDIPEISDNASLSGEFEIPRPDPLGNEVLVDAVRINKLGNDQWILIDGSPGEVWPRLRAFLSRNNLAVARADAVNGMIETGWLQPVGENALSERFRLRVEQGVQRQTTEVHVLHADARAGESWPESSSNGERESIMVQSLAQYLADSQVAVASVSMLAQQAMGSSGKVSLEEDEQRKPYILLELPFVRAWASVGLAIQKGGFTIDDMNRSESIYYMRVDETAEDEDEDEPGFFAGLFFGDDEEESDNKSGTLYIIRIESQQTEEVHISVEPSEGNSVSGEQATYILKRIKKNLS